jgi:membrane protease YdiL (CAAX protease family)
MLAFGRVIAGRPVLFQAPRRGVPWGLVDIIIVLALLALTQQAAGLWLSRGCSIDLTADPQTLSLSSRALMLLAVSASSLLAVLCSLPVTRWRTGASWRDLGMDTSFVGRDVAFGAVAFAMTAPPVYAIQIALTRWFPSEHPLALLLKEESEPGFVLVALFCAVLVAPIAEEFLFRVLLQGWLENAGKLRWSLQEFVLGQQAPHHAPESDAENDANQTFRPPLWPAFVSALLFAGVHASHGPDPIALFVFALGLGYLYRQTHRVLPCIVVHLLLNTCSLAALLLGLQ